MYQFKISVQVMLLGVCASASVAQDSTFDQIGYTALLERLGAATPTGAGIGVGQVEASSGGSYGPDQTDSEFDGVTFTSHAGTPGASGHATTVGKNYYGSVTSIAPGVPNAHLFEANAFLNTGYLNYGTNEIPESPPFGMEVFNLSFIGETSVDAQLLRRADYAAHAYGTLWCVGVNNGVSSTTPALFSGMFHAIAVGVTSGDHGFNDQTIDGGPRMKPDLVAPAQYTSFATPIVASCGVLLHEVTETDPQLTSNSNASRTQVMKAILMGGATHNAAWTNNPVESGVERGVTHRPIDEVFGAGVVNIDRAHRMMTGYEQNGSSNAVPSSANIEGPGWDWEYVSTDESVYYRFDLSERADEVVFAATWHRLVPPTFISNIPMPNLDLHLWRVENEALIDLVGADTSVFGGGNVESSSTFDNVEYIRVIDLAAGEYVLEMVRQDAGSASRGAIAWWLPEPSGDVLGDLNGDGLVNGADLGLMLAMFGTSDPVGDLNGDGVVNGADIGLMLAAWTG